MILTTTDTLPQKYQVIGLVHVPFLLVNGFKRAMKPLDLIDAVLTENEKKLAERAAQMGGNAVIGIRTQTFGIEAVLMGTVVRCE